MIAPRFGTVSDGIFGQKVNLRGDRAMKEGKLPMRDVAKRMGVSVAALYRCAGKRGAGDDIADVATHG